MLAEGRGEGAGGEGRRCCVRVEAPCGRCWSSLTSPQSLITVLLESSISEGKKNLLNASSVPSSLPSALSYLPFPTHSSNSLSSSNPLLRQGSRSDFQRPPRPRGGGSPEPSTAAAAARCPGAACTGGFLPWSSVFEQAALRRLHRGHQPNALQRSSAAPGWVRSPTGGDVGIGPERLPPSPPCLPSARPPRAEHHLQEQQARLGPRAATCKARERKAADARRSLRLPAAAAVTSQILA